MKNTILFIAGLLFIKVNLIAQISPKGWSKSGTGAGSYIMKIKANEGLNNSNALVLEASKENILGSGAVIQTINASNYTGKRIKLSAFIKTENVKEFACLILCSQNNLADFWENTSVYEDKKTFLKGNHNFKKIECYLNVNYNFGNLVLGAMIKGEGKIWLDNFKIEILENLPDSVQIYSKEPQNTEFEDSLVISADSKIGYLIENEQVIFTFQSTQFSETTDGMSGWRQRLKDHKIKKVYVAGDFNNWEPKNKQFLMVEKGNVYELKLPLNELTNNKMYEFKFVINGNKWVEPNNDMINKTQSGNWVGNNNLVLILP